MTVNVIGQSSNGPGAVSSVNTETGAVTMFPGQVFDVCATYSAQGNLQLSSDAAITASSTALHSTNAAFTSADAGKSVMVVGAGPSTSTTTTGSTLSTSTAITSLSVSALSANIPAGATITVTSGAHTQAFGTPGASAGATSIPVYSQYPNYAYAAGSTVVSSSNLVTTISSVSAGVATLATAAGKTISSGGYIAWGTDDTAAFIAAINACYTAGGGIVYLGSKKYCIAGALQTAATAGPETGTFTYCAQIPLPALGLDTGTDVDKINIKLLGDFDQGLAAAGSGGSSPALGVAPIARSPMMFCMATGGSSSGSLGGNLPCMIGGPDWGSNNDFDFLNLNFVAENVQFVCEANPSYTPLNLAFLSQCSVRNCRMFTLAPPYENAPQPCNPTGQGVVMPQFYCDVYNDLDRTSILGYYAGITPGEHTRFRLLNLDVCYMGINIQSNAGQGHLIAGEATIQRSQFAIAGVSLTAGLQGATFGSNVCYIDFELCLEMNDGFVSWSTGEYLMYSNGGVYGSIGFHNNGTNAPPTLLGTGTFPAMYDLQRQLYNIGGTGMPAFQNNWSAKGSGYTNVGFWTDEYGYVHLQGAIINSGNTTIGTQSTVFTLPAPWAGTSEQAIGFAQILASGWNSTPSPALILVNAGAIIVNATTTAGNIILLDGISFKYSG